MDLNFLTGLIILNKAETSAQRTQPGLGLGR